MTITSADYAQIRERMQYLMKSREHHRLLDHILALGEQVDDCRDHDLDHSIFLASQGNNPYRQELNLVLEEVHHIATKNDPCIDDLHALEGLREKERQLRVGSEAITETLMQDIFKLRVEDIKKSIMKVLLSEDRYSGTRYVCTTGRRLSSLETEGASLFPDQWQESLWGDLTIAPFTVLSSSKGSYYSEGRAFVDTHDFRASTVCHEMMHCIEDRYPWMVDIQLLFLSRRTMDLQQGRTDSGKDFIFSPQSDIDPYPAKIYSSLKHAELLSCGMEALTFGRRGGLIGLNGYCDSAQWRHLTLGVLAYCNQDDRLKTFDISNIARDKETINV